MPKTINNAITCPKMGAVPGARGVAFRVWAPHAERVFVTGTFNDWSKTLTPLAKEKNGYWFAKVSKAKTGDEYRYLIHGSKGPH
jgi:1,4-alpha-glucan branching enzyme